MLTRASDREYLRYCLMEGLGAEDCAVMGELDLEDIRGEIRAMRVTGDLARLYADKARRARG